MPPSSWPVLIYPQQGCQLATLFFFLHRQCAKKAALLPGRLMFSMLLANNQLLHAVVDRPIIGDQQFNIHRGGWVQLVVDLHAGI